MIIQLCIDYRTHARTFVSSHYQRHHSVGDVINQRSRAVDIHNVNEKVKQNCPRCIRFFLLRISGGPFLLPLTVPTA